MRFQVPQFIEIEDKIFGPFTLKQFIYLAGGLALSFIIFQYLYTPLAVILIIAVLGFSAAMAFYQINNKPLIYILQSAVGYFFSSKLYLWQKKDKVKTAPKVAVPTGAENKLYVPKLSQSKLHDLTWSLDINENLDSNSEDSVDR